MCICVACSIFRTRRPLKKLSFRLLEMMIPDSRNDAYDARPKPHSAKKQMHQGKPTSFPDVQHKIEKLEKQLKSKCLLN